MKHQRERAPRNEPCTQQEDIALTAESSS
jgi:hypothetical protein